MFLTQCAACAAPLGLTLGKKCGRCSTRYCGPECQKKHWEEGGHDKLCKLIKKSGGAEQYNANQKYAEAVAVAAEKCAEDTKGQTCYICTQALHWKTKEGLVRGCSCRGTAGVAHVSCLVEQAKILVAEAEENNLGHDAFNARWRRWCSCSLCEQEYHGVVKCALGWACWKTYLGRPETDEVQGMAMSLLGSGLFFAYNYEGALLVYEAILSMLRRVGPSEEQLLVVQSHLASTYRALGRNEEALQMDRDIYSGRLRLNGEGNGHTLLAANNYASGLVDLRRLEEAKSVLRKMIPVARRVFGDTGRLTLTMRKIYARALYEDAGATLDDLREAVTTLVETERIVRRVMGGAHPTTTAHEAALQEARAVLSARETSPTSNNA